MDDITQQLESLLQEEEQLQFTQFTNEMAFQIGCTMVERMKLENKHITIDITRNGQQLFHYAFPKTSADNDQWVRRKGNVATRFGHSSHYISTYLKSIQKNIQERYYVDPADYAASGGAFPIIVKDVGVVGAIAVSGLAQEEDHSLVTSVIKPFIN
ncbi:heme-degrading domain-containing protein [Paenibacillus radicis (ex Xue et al. 2023)]|uniref:Heme-degrading domain-containing protein n=1 Tax=Paenibacillus radicis (ex Xue et al. 2023) TaxID=2972489 RepID=A0ABT1YIP8_9BACL|nr:heme-degrading domain-containing protein [Paenibacillus radicis (ex Xue et al. 2023)]MCR8633056.1 heme-degrading domain-containing protein [Paenibacillus radicis (ex Xue et al. 2023)]